MGYGVENTARGKNTASQSEPSILSLELPDQDSSDDPKPAGSSSYTGLSAQFNERDTVCPVLVTFRLLSHKLYFHLNHNPTLETSTRNLTGIASTYGLKNRNSISDGATNPLLHPAILETTNPINRRSVHQRPPQNRTPRAP